MLYSCAFSIATLKVTKNLGQILLFTSWITIPVQQCGFWDSVDSVGGDVLLSLNLIYSRSF